MRENGQASYPVDGSGVYDEESEADADEPEGHGNPGSGGKQNTQSRGTKNRRAGGAAMHLSDEAVALILKHILLGDTNAMINQQLQLNGYLKLGDSLSQQTLSKYRQDPRAKVQRDRLTDEAVQAGHVMLSESISRAIEQAVALDAYIQRAPGVLHPRLDPKHLKIYMDLQMSRWEFVWDKLGNDELVKKSYESAKASQEESEDSNKSSNGASQGMSELEKRELIVQMKTEFATLLRRLVAEQQAKAAVAESV